MKKLLMLVVTLMLGTSLALAQADTSKSSGSAEKPAATKTTKKAAKKPAAKKDKSAKAKKADTGATK
jgi:Ni/Co efflux regulator RcnB